MHSPKGPKLCLGEEGVARLRLIDFDTVTLSSLIRHGCRTGRRGDAQGAMHYTHSAYRRTLLCRSTSLFLVSEQERTELMWEP